jgi:MoxR-like ATPase
MAGSSDTNNSFSGTADYVATRELQTAVNAAIALQRPLLIKGEPGTGKTLLAFEVAKALGKQLFTWHVKSTTTAQQGLYEYDAVSRLRDSQLGDSRVNQVENYIKKGKIWEAFSTDEQSVLLIDEIDKADIEFPNDLLQELDSMEFYCYELKQTIKAKHRPIIIITSNNEKELPDAFLRRCFFHFIRFPDKETMQQIVNVHYQDIEETLLTNALKTFFGIREIKNLKKRPSTSELIDWLKLLLVGRLSAEDLNDLSKMNEIPPFLGALLKNESDYDLYKALREKGIK